MDNSPDRSARDDTALPGSVRDASSSPSLASGADAGPVAGPPPALGKWLLIYSLLRVVILVVLAAVLSLLMPLILALLFAIVLALPLSWLLFGGVRRRVNAAMAVSSAERRAERERLRSALDGQPPQ